MRDRWVAQSSAEHGQGVSLYGLKVDEKKGMFKNIKHKILKHV
jgi:hypothetical protein